MIDPALHTALLALGIEFDATRRRYRKRLNRTLLDALGKLSLPAGARLEVWDAERPDLLVRIGAKSISFNVYRRMPAGQWKRIALGRYPALTPEQARMAAGLKGDEVAKGLDPAEEKRKRRRVAAVEALTLRDAWREYQKHVTLKPRSVETYASALERIFPTQLDQPITRITCETVERKLAELKAQRPGALLQGLKVLRAVCNFVNDRYDRPDGAPLFARLPTARLKRHWPKLKRRKTCLRPHQLAAFFEAVLALDNARSNGLADVARDYLLALLLTGMRKRELAQLKLADLDLQGRLFRVSTKNGDTLELPVGDYLGSILKRRAEAAPGAYVFPGRRSPHFDDERHWLNKVKAASGLDFCPHDLRRTFATVAEELDISPYALKRLLSHRVPSAEEVTEGYISLSTERLRRAMQKIETFMLAHGGVLEAATVVALPGRIANDDVSPPTASNSAVTLVTA